MTLFFRFLFLQKAIARVTRILTVIEQSVNSKSALKTVQNIGLSFILYFLLRSYQDFGAFWPGFCHSRGPQLQGHRRQRQPSISENTSGATLPVIDRTRFRSWIPSRHSRRPKSFLILQLFCASLNFNAPLMHRWIPIPMSVRAGQRLVEFW